MLEDIYPLSPLQEGLYYHWLSAPGADFYISQMCCGFTGKLDIKILEESYQELINRHAVLRTYFTHEIDDKPLQVVKKGVKGVFDYKVISGDETCATCSTQSYREADRAKGFDLHAGSQMRLTVLGLGSDAYEFIWTHHHIVMDGWCMNLLIKDFFETYYRLLRGAAPEVKKVSLYSSYIKWLDKIEKANSLRYWHQYLAGYDTESSINLFGAKESTDAYNGQERTFSIKGARLEAVRNLCRQSGVTENTFVQTLWGILLGRYNSTNDVVFGSVVSGRPAELEGVEDTIGLFINTIPVRIQTTDATSGMDLLKQVQQSFVNGTNHHYVQLADIQAQSKLGRNLFDHLIVFENK